MRNYHERVDPYDIFEREAAEEIIEKRNEDRRRAIEAEKVRTDWEAKQAAETAERSRQFSLRANRDQVLAEYREAGVKPPFVHENGYPTASLSLLLSFGWKIETVGDVRTLVAPPVAKQTKRKSRADYEQST